MAEHCTPARLAIFLSILFGVHAALAQGCQDAFRLKTQTESRIPGHSILVFENNSGQIIRIRLMGNKGMETGEQVYSSISLAAHGSATMNLAPDQYTVLWSREEPMLHANEQEDQKVLLMGATGKLYIASTSFPHLDSDARQNLELAIKPNTKTLLTFEGCGPGAEKPLSENEQQSERLESQPTPPIPSDQIVGKKPQRESHSLSPIRDCSKISARDRTVGSLSKLCALVKNMDRALPNVTCEQTTQRYFPIDSFHRNAEVRRADDLINDTITATVTYENGVDQYSGVKLGDHSAQNQGLNGGMPIATGDFGSGLLSIFREENATVFSFREETDSPDREFVFDFRIPAATNHTFTYYENGTGTHPDLSGAMWVDAESGEVRRLRILASGIAPAFSADHIRFDTTFAKVRFGDSGDFLLPTDSEAVVCARSGGCQHNVTHWANCRRLAAKSRIILNSD